MEDDRKLIERWLLQYHGGNIAILAHIADEHAQILLLHTSQFRAMNQCTIFLQCHFLLHANDGTDEGGYVMLIGFRPCLCLKLSLGAQFFPENQL